jgi:hypothetical protein
MTDRPVAVVRAGSHGDACPACQTREAATTPWRTIPEIRRSTSASSQRRGAGHELRKGPRAPPRPLPGRDRQGDRRRRR